MLNANYLATRLKGTSGALPHGKNGRGARVHHRPAPAEGATGVTEDDIGQAADGLRLPRPDHELPGAGHHHDRTDRGRTG